MVGGKTRRQRRQVAQAVWLDSGSVVRTLRCWLPMAGGARVFTFVSVVAMRRYDRHITSCMTFIS